jgi:hypothetical protein
MKIKNFIILTLIIITAQPVLSQTDTIQETRLAERLHSLSRNAPKELVYIQTSKDIYETGEDLLFKVYLLDAQSMIPSMLSRTLYLQLQNENTKKSVWQEKYEIRNGFANGQVYLESNLPEGDYLLEAFTANSFFNDSSEFKSLKRIKIVNDITLQPKLKSNPDSVLNRRQIQFTVFPEGGNLVSGLQSNLAFKAVNRNGEPLNVKGTLYENSTPLTEFKSIHAGMGSLIFTPDASKKYYIRLTEPSLDSTFLLPDINSTGISLQLTSRDKESVSFRVLQSPGMDKEIIYLRVQCRGVVYGMTSAVLKRELRIKLPVDSLPQGISEVTLFNSKMIPVAERLVYNNIDRKINITARLSKEIYYTRGKATLEITAKDEMGNPVEANLGISIFDKLYQNPRDSDNIFAHCYLSAQLKGRIYNPSFYFNSSSKDRETAMDLLLLTQGWRRYIWNENNLAKSENAREQIIFDGVKGSLYYPRRRNKIPKEQTFIIAFSPNKDSLKVMIPADSLGKFTVSPDLLETWENDYAYLKPFGPYKTLIPPKDYDPLSKPEYSLILKLNEPFEILGNTLRSHEISYPVSCLSTETENRSENYSVATGVIRIKEVTIKGQKGNKLRGKYMGTLDSIMKYSNDDYVCVYGVLNCPRHPPGTFVPPSEYPKFPCLEKKPMQGKTYVVIINYNTPGEYTRKITYFRPLYTEDELLRVNNLSRIKAYYGEREFYKPDYDRATDEVVPDFRNTLLWEPDVITDENGKATLTFFCSDINTDFVGRIEGVSGNGLLGTGNFKFTVRKLK